MAKPTEFYESIRALGGQLVSFCRPTRLRTMRQFAEEEIILPDGPYKNRLFRCDRQPYSALWFEAIDSENWKRAVATGPTQSGKTLTCFVIPIMYHLFEVNETVICGLPSMDMAADKWREDLKPAIEASRYRSLLPEGGGGSRGGSNFTAIKFKNGATLKFMSGGGSDKKRAAFTSRVLVITETDGMDEASQTSREADKITQMEGRTLAFSDRARIYMECTVSIEEGRTWKEYQAGTRSRIMKPCPHCGKWMQPEREHLSGWKDKENVQDAREGAEWSCSECGEVLTEEDRRNAALNSLLVHQGQEIKDGKVVGELPKTNTLGFRWSAFDNLFQNGADIAEAEWNASRDSDEENAEKQMRQFFWCLPYLPPVMDVTNLDAHQLARRQNKSPRGLVPEDAKHLTVGIDVGRHLCHWVCIAWLDGAFSQVVDYGRFDVPSNIMAEERAILVALRDFRDSYIIPGWKFGEGSKSPDMTLVDAGYKPESVQQFIAESGSRVLASIGFGASQDRTKSAYSKPKGTGTSIVHIGENYHVERMRGGGRVVHVNADYWKTYLHTRLGAPMHEGGAMTLFAAPPHDHFGIAKHWTAEKQIEEYVQGKGLIVRWDRVHRNNHWLDSSVLACVAGHMVGIRIAQGNAQKPAPRQITRRQQAVSGPGGWSTR